MAAILGTSVGNFDKTYRQYAGSGDVRQDQRRVFFRAAGIIENMLRSRVDQATAAAAVTSDGDVLLFNGETSDEGMRRWRLAKAKIAELEYEQKSKQLVPRAQVRTGLSRLAHIMRGFGELLQRDFGDGGYDAFEEFLTDCERVISDLFESGELAVDTAEGEQGAGVDDAHHDPARQNGTRRAAPNARRGKAAKTSKRAGVRRKRDRPA